jgi:hypothetical protein
MSQLGSRRSFIEEAKRRILYKYGGEMFLEETLGPLSVHNVNYTVQSGKKVFRRPVSAASLYVMNGKPFIGTSILTRDPIFVVGPDDDWGGPEGGVVERTKRQVMYQMTEPVVNDENITRLMKHYHEESIAGLFKYLTKD